MTTTDRAAAERQFFNEYAEQLDRINIDPALVFAPTCLENQHLLARFGDLKGKRVLDIGCGQGDSSVYFALKGAEVWAIDVSDRMIEFTARLAAKHGVGDRVHAEVRRVEDMPYPDNYFDMIFADGVLHHIDMAQGVPQLVRVLKAGGQGFFMEPQKGSIFIEMYRWFAGNLRSADEKPLEPQDVQFLGKHFATFDHDEYHFVSLLMFGVRFLQLKLTGKAFTLWMDEVREGQWHPKLLLRLQAIDDKLLGKFPALRKYCWMTVLRVQK